jgi:hypothetical protein
MAARIATARSDDRDRRSGDVAPAADAERAVGVGLSAMRHEQKQKGERGE